MNATEIKFRGKKIDNNEWVIGSLVMVCDGETLKRYPCIVISYNHDSFDWHEVDQQTVGQFIGIRDKDGIEIFEGDIITDHEFAFNLIVGYSKDAASFAGSKINDFDVQNCHWFNNDIDITQGWEVIGNIYENKELLNK